MSDETNTLGYAQASVIPIQTDINTVVAAPYKKYIPGFYDPASNKLGKYHDFLGTIRWFYKFNPIASTVINRMADMSMTQLRHRKRSKLNSEVVDEPTLAFYDALAKKIRPFLKLMALEYLLHGMVVPAYTFDKIRGNLLSEKLGRKKYTYPKNIWVRNPDNIELRRKPLGMERTVYLKIPQEDVDFVLSKGMRIDGSIDTEGYNELVNRSPEYVRAIQNGRRVFLLEDARPILRKATSYDDYPIPFLVAALQPLQHKDYLKLMDRSIVNRAIEAVRLIKTGNDQYPAQDDDIKDLKSQVVTNSSTGERIFNLFTNHTVEIDWIIPPMEALLNEAKYDEANADIFLALGFPRILTTGETLRSNSSDSKIASLGPKATLDEMREAIILWLEYFYQEIAELNGFTRYPEPYFSPIATSDYTALVQFAIQALEAGAISKDTVAQLYGSDYDTEAAQIEAEIDMNVPSPSERAVEKQQEFTVQQSDTAFERQQQLAKQNQQQNTNNNNNNNKGGNNNTK